MAEVPPFIQNSINKARSMAPIQIPLTVEMRKYLLGIIKWYYAKNINDTQEYTDRIEFDRLEAILINGYYKEGDKDYLNDLRFRKHYIDVDIKDQIARAKKQAEYDDLPF